MRSSRSPPSRSPLIRSCYAATRSCSSRAWEVQAEHGGNSSIWSAPTSWCCHRTRRRRRCASTIVACGGRRRRVSRARQPSAPRRPLPHPRSAGGCPIAAGRRQRRADLRRERRTPLLPQLRPPRRSVRQPRTGPRPRQPLPAARVPPRRVGLTVGDPPAGAAQRVTRRAPTRSSARFSASRASAGRVDGEKLLRREKEPFFDQRTDTEYTGSSANALPNFSARPPGGRPLRSVNGCRQGATTVTIGERAGRKRRWPASAQAAAAPPDAAASPARVGAGVGCVGRPGQTSRLLPDVTASTATPLVRT